MTPPSPQRGQIWADNDPRSAGRTLRVDRIENGKAVCTILTNSDKAQRDIDAKRGKPSYYQDFKDMRGKTTKISLARFKPVSTGYRLIRDEQYGIRWGSDSPVFAFGSRAIAEQALADDGRGIGVLVVHEYEPHTPNSTEWREVEDR